MGGRGGGGFRDIHVVLELLQVRLLLSQLLLELQELFLLTRADGEILVGLLALLESVTVVPTATVNTLVSLTAVVIWSAQPRNTAMQRWLAGAGKGHTASAWPSKPTVSSP